VKGFSPELIKTFTNKKLKVKIFNSDGLQPVEKETKLYVFGKKFAQKETFRKI